MTAHKGTPRLVASDMLRPDERFTSEHEPAGTCVVADDDERLCGRDALPGAPWPVCATHALAAYRHIAQLMTEHGVHHCGDVIDSA